MRPRTRLFFWLGHVLPVVLALTVAGCSDLYRRNVTIDNGTEHTIVIERFLLPGQERGTVQEVGAGVQTGFGVIEETGCTGPTRWIASVDEVKIAEIDEPLCAGWRWTFEPAHVRLEQLGSGTPVPREWLTPRPVEYPD